MLQSGDKTCTLKHRDDVLNQTKIFFLNFASLVKRDKKKQFFLIFNKSKTLSEFACLIAYNKNKFWFILTFRRAKVILTKDIIFYKLVVLDLRNKLILNHAE